MAAAENGDLTVTPTPESGRRPDFGRQSSIASVGTVNTSNGQRLDDLLEVDNEQETVRSLTELKKKLEDISRKPSGVDNPSFEDDSVEHNQASEETIKH